MAVIKRSARTVRYVMLGSAAAIAITLGGYALRSPPRGDPTARLRLKLAAITKKGLHQNGIDASVVAFGDTLVVGAWCDRTAMISMRDALERMNLAPATVFSAMRCLGGSELRLR